VRCLAWRGWETGESVVTRRRFLRLPKLRHWFLAILRILPKRPKPPVDCCLAYAAGSGDRLPKLRHWYLAILTSRPKRPGAACTSKMRKTLPYNFAHLRRLVRQAGARLFLCFQRALGEGIIADLGSECSSRFGQGERSEELGARSEERGARE
jgi:hypothetical protein